MDWAKANFRKRWFMTWFLSPVWSAFLVQLKGVADPDPLTSARSQLGSVDPFEQLWGAAHSLVRAHQGKPALAMASLRASWRSSYGGATHCNAADEDSASCVAVIPASKLLFRYHGRHPIDARTRRDGLGYH